MLDCHFESWESVTAATDAVITINVRLLFIGYIFAAISHNLCFSRGKPLAQDNNYLLCGKNV